MLLHIHPKNPEPRKIKIVVDCLMSGGTIIYPTDTVYGLGCDIFQHKAVEKICKLKNVDPEKSNLTFICNSLSHITDFVHHIDTPLFRILKQCVPGPYTFIMPASKEVPKILRNKKKTIGIRVPDNIICTNILEMLGHPILSSSLHHDDALVDYIMDPEMIFDKYENLVDIIIDGGFGGKIPSTILDCTNKQIEVMRQGLGLVDFLE